MTLTPVAYFPKNYFLENLAVRADGALLITAVLRRELWWVPRPQPGTLVEPVLVHTFDHPVTGIVEAAPGVFVINLTEAYTIGESHLARVDLTDWAPRQPVTPEIICTFDERARGLNGSRPPDATRLAALRTAFCPRPRRVGLADRLVSRNAGDAGGLRATHRRHRLLGRRRSRSPPRWTPFISGPNGAICTPAMATASPPRSSRTPATPCSLSSPARRCRRSHRLPARRRPVRLRLPLSQAMTSPVCLPPSADPAPVIDDIFGFADDRKVFRATTRRKAPWQSGAVRVSVEQCGRCVQRALRSSADKESNNWMATVSSLTLLRWDRSVSTANASSAPQPVWARIAPKQLMLSALLWSGNDQWHRQTGLDPHLAGAERRLKPACEML
ncbi:hypothetical protein [Candidatus Mycobacterium methanotrophicum]|uniref:Uncharacterized protein n=1 Tax=Candidatus Mycobacterium methanotrophicum TaxID=2943498 RepID=A0ABY4QKG3_9MYCO|nr:hypothetical protein [Candidatus Mycobacterium methanotrophicum]UQX10967.1 hypothetical protein M5I08_24150 [Candidatus Mycobacterium methanotrophicum]